MSAGDTDPEMQVLGEWQITQIGSENVPAELGLTVTFNHGSASFFGGCNTIHANPRFGPHNFRLNVTGMTKGICKREVMEREAALVETIATVDMLTVGPGEALAFYDGMNELVIVAKRSEPKLR